MSAKIYLSSILTIFFLTPVSSFAQPSISNIWHVDGTTSGLRCTRSATFSNHGAVIASDINGANGRVSFLSPTFTNVPVISTSQSQNMQICAETAAARNADVTAVLMFNFQSGGVGYLTTPTISLFKNGSTIPLWSQTFATATTALNNIMGKISISDDGQKILAAWPDNIASKMALLSGSGAILTSAPLTAPMYNIIDFRLTGDGSQILLNIGGSSQLSMLNPVTFAQIGLPAYMELSPAGKISITPDRKAAVSARMTPSGTIPPRLYLLQDNGINLASSSYVSLPLGSNPLATAISDNGATVAVASIFSTSANITTKIFSVVGTQLIEVFSDDTITAATAQLSNWPTTMKISPDGKFVIVGMTGDSPTGPKPELVIYKKVGVTYQKAYERTDLGSIFSIDINPGGTQAAIVSNAFHSGMTSNTEAKLDLVDLESTVRVIGVPHPGSSITVQHLLTPAGKSILARSTTLIAPITMPNFLGNLFLAAPQIVDRTTANAQGVATYNLPLSANTGERQFLQAVSLGNRTFSPGFVAVAPY